MKYLKDYKLFESHKFPTDEDEIDMICHELNLKNYTINPDGTVDVKGGFIDLSFMKLKRLPLKFGKASSFYCDQNYLTSLEGSPREVVNFSCKRNELTSLKGGPEIVRESFSCSYNKLIDLEGAPKKFGKRITFFAGDNNLFSLNGLPDEYDYANFFFENNPVCIFEDIFKNKFFASLKYKYFFGDNKIHESRFVRACDDLGIKAPDEIEGYVWV